MDAELYELLTELGRAGYLVHTYQLDQHGPLVVAAVLRRGTCADVLIVHDEHRAYSFRTPAGAGQDVLDPVEVFWDCPARPARAYQGSAGPARARRQGSAHRDVLAAAGLLPAGRAARRADDHATPGDVMKCRRISWKRLAESGDPLVTEGLLAYQ